MNKYAFSLISCILIKNIILIIILTKEAVNLNGLQYFKNSKQIYDDKEEFDKMKAYNVNSYTFKTVKLMFYCLKLIVFIGFGYLYKICKSLKLVYKEKNEMIKESLCAAAFVCVNSIVDMPLQIYFLYFILAKYGFYKTDFLGYLLSEIVGLFLFFLFSFLFCVYFLFLYKKCKKYLWIAVFCTLIVSTYVIRVCSYLAITGGYELLPLKKEDYRSKIHGLANKVGFEANNIYKVEMSNEISLPNAFCCGDGSNSKIIIFDNLYDILTKNQIVSVVCHELGHWHHKHLKSFSVKKLIIYILFSYFFCYFLRKKARKSDYPIMLLFLYHIFLFQSIYDVIFLILNDRISWRYELQADNFAYEMGYGKYLIEALTKMQKFSLNNVYGSQMFYKYLSTHPPLFTRIECLEDPHKFDEFCNKLF